MGGHRTVDNTTRWFILLGQIVYGQPREVIGLCSSKPLMVSSSRVRLPKIGLFFTHLLVCDNLFIDLGLTATNCSRGHSDSPVPRQTNRFPIRALENQIHSKEERKIWQYKTLDSKHPNSPQHSPRNHHLIMYIMIYWSLIIWINYSGSSMLLTTWITE